MFKLVVLCACIAAAVAEPNPGVAVPVTYSTYSTGAVAAPFAATYVNPVSGVYETPVAYSSPFGYSHFIKKRAAQLYSGYVAPTYYSTPLATTYSAPYVGTVVPSAPVYTTAAHLIKKRAAVFPAATYVAPTTYTATAPFVSTAYSAPVYSTPYVSAAPVYPTHFIKK